MRGAGLKRALISVSEKSGVVEFARELKELGYMILSTGGTKKILLESGIEVTGVDEVTGFPEILDGRVKTLHPRIHGGLLARRNNEEHVKAVEEQGIDFIDLVCVNLYPFQQTIAMPNVTEEEAIENIDIGGPSMLRSAAKNFEDVTVVVDYVDYQMILSQLREKGEVDRETRCKLAAKVFRHTAAYDAYIAEYLTKCAQEENPEQLTLTYEKMNSLRYGENPHQQASFYRTPMGSDSSIAAARQWNGKELSFNNIRDADAALQMVKEFSEPAAVAVKHMNPCGVGVGDTVLEAFERAYQADPISIFGGIVAINRPVDLETAEKLHEIFLEIVMAPAFTEEALELLKGKKNLRLLTVSFDQTGSPERMLTSVGGGLLLQDQDTLGLEDAELRVVTKREPSEEEWKALKLGWSIVKHVKSNAIVVSNAEMTLGVGAGQMNRVGAAKIALEQAGEKAQGAALASDAFFPMEDTVEAAAKAGITAIIQPGGSIRDEDSIKKADEYGITMVVTGIRHFKH
ncbi:bifunctional phosphoribosylaminoimidazolecarboxamide formyltransferase/IMP cyclohydrolase [Bacillus coahuilensis]|uniref:bifunctional phosphoribosylaminoimidazolecarboxamide formyltransferase/IMP cyclohydrolase n=1 Tax=Bacillus coahuilensis TaxID=408580 RepID=UPI00187C530B|nr:bifunctional phosphoribosylaminoimidazolecarboxamide formyltransferase/IMP cyclohydrolase [Bacillus coahuilensis]